MRNLVMALLAMLFVSSGWADTSAFERFLYDGSYSDKEISLDTEKTRTEYRDETIWTTCYRTVYRTRCHHQPGHCYPVCDNRGNCRTVCTGGQRICRQYPEQQAYSCQRVVRRAYQVHDYYVKSNFSLDFNSEDAANNTAENFTVNAKGNTASITVKASGENFVSLLSKNLKERREAGLLTRDIDYNIEVKSAVAAKNVSAMGFQNVKKVGDFLYFELHSDFNFSEFTNKIRVFSYRRFRRDILLKTMFLSPNQMRVLSSGNGVTQYEIDLTKLGIRLPGRMRVIMDVEYKVDNTKLLNKGQIDTDTSTNWIFR